MEPQSPFVCHRWNLNLLRPLRREDAGPAPADPLPGLGPGERGAAVPLPHHGHVHVALHARLRVLALRVSIPAGVYVI